MKLHAYTVVDERYLMSAPCLTLEPGDRTDRRWVDVEGGTPAQLRELLEPLELHPLIIENILEGERSTRVSVLDEALFFEFPAQAHNPPGIEPPDPDAVEPPPRAYFSFVMRSGLLLTLHANPHPGIGRMIALLSGQVKLYEASLSALVYEILDALVDESMVAALRLRQTVETISQEVDEAPEIFESRRLLRLERRVARLNSRCEDQLYCVISLQPADMRCDCLDLRKEYVAELQSNLEQSLRAVRRIEDRVEDLRLYVSSALQRKADGRLAVLTIVSSIFTPLTFLAGVYGMNFHYMPELEAWWAYPAVLGSMVTLAVGLLVTFWRLGWFK